MQTELGYKIPFRTAVPFWGQTTRNLAVCPENGSAVLKGLRSPGTQKRLSPITGDHSK